ncbi:MAG: ATP phosphoribosyltransferase regulatory subunit, partial [Clostridiaceae bacterium]
LKSLQRIDSNAVLVISHIQLVSSFLKQLSLPESVIKTFELCIKNKNLHDLLRLANREGIDEELVNNLKKVMALNGTIQQVLPRLKGMVKGEEMKRAYEELEALCQILIDSELEKFINIDLSVINHLDYYNGIIFQGYVEKAPDMVLSGGRYDRLAGRIGEGIGAIGFAVYIDALNSCYPRKKSFDTEVLIINEDGENTAALLEEVERLASENHSVRVERSLPEAHRAERIYVFREGVLKEVSQC